MCFWAILFSCVGMYVCLRLTITFTTLSFLLCRAEFSQSYSLTSVVWMPTGASEQFEQRFTSCLLHGAVRRSNQRHHRGDWSCRRAAQDPELCGSRGYPRTLLDRAPRGPRCVGTSHQAPSDATVGGSGDFRCKECPDTRTTWTTDQSDSASSTPRGAEYQG